MCGGVLHDEVGLAEELHVAVLGAEELVEEGELGVKGLLPVGHVCALLFTASRDLEGLNVGGQDV